MDVKIDGVDVKNINMRNNAISKKINIQTKINKSNNAKLIKRNENKMPEESVTKLINAINNKLDILNKEIRFSYIKGIGAFIIKVINVNTGEVIREIPPKQIVNLEKKLSELVGMIFDKREGGV